MPTRKVVDLQTGSVEEVELTPAEVAAAQALKAAEDAANHPDQLEAEVAAMLNGGNGPRIDWKKLIKAKVISDLAFRLGKAPGTLTGAELNAERNRIAAIYKAL